LLEEDWEVEIAAPSKDVIKTVVHDFEPGWATYTEKLSYRWKPDKSFREVNPGEYDGLVIPGGRLPEYIRLDEDMKRIVGHFLETSKPVAAICHAPLVLVAVAPEKLRGRTMTSYITVKPEVENVGAKWVDKEVVVDGEPCHEQGLARQPGLNERVQETSQGETKFLVHDKPLSKTIFSLGLFHVPHASHVN